jgi:hypothetical protein
VGVCGPNPVIPFLAADIEVMFIIDAKRYLEIIVN